MMQFGQPTGYQPQSQMKVRSTGYKALHPVSPQQGMSQSLQYKPQAQSVPTSKTTSKPIEQKKEQQKPLGWDLTKPGLYTLSIMRGRNLKNKDWGKQDPYVKVDYGKKKPFRTKTHWKGGISPIWEAVLELDLDGTSRDLDISCWDEDRFSRDDLIGQGKINLYQILEAGGKEVFFHIHGKKNDKSLGEISFTGTFFNYIPGTLNITLNNGRNLKNRDYGKQDPYVVFTLDGIRKRKAKFIGKVELIPIGIKDVHIFWMAKNAIWNSTFTIRISSVVMTRLELR